MNAIILTFAVLFGFPVVASAAQTTATIPVSITVDHKIDDRVSNLEKSKMICYQLAAKATFVSEERVQARWFESLKGESHVWRVSRMSSGLTCRVLIKNANTSQFGPGARYMGCQCIGNLVVAK